jgi:anti-anti-sigma factor
VSFVIGRQLGTVEVTVIGDLDAVGSELLAGALRDLVDGQGNLDVIVDVAGRHCIDDTALEAIAAIAQTSAQRGGRLRLRSATDTDAVIAALAAAGLDDLVMARQGSGAARTATEGKDASRPDPTGGPSTFRTGLRWAATVSSSSRRRSINQSEPALHEDLDGHAVGDQIFFEQLADELVVTLRG